MSSIRRVRITGKSTSPHASPLPTAMVQPVFDGPLNATVHPHRVKIHHALQELLTFEPPNAPLLRHVLTELDNLPVDLWPDYVCNILLSSTPLAASTFSPLFQQLVVESTHTAYRLQAACQFLRDEVRRLMALKNTGRPLRPATPPVSGIVGSGSLFSNINDAGKS